MKTFYSRIKPLAHIMSFLNSCYSVTELTDFASFSEMEQAN